MFYTNSYFSLRNRLIVADSEGLYGNQSQTLMGKSVSALYYWCNCLGEINIPGAAPGYVGKEEEIPPYIAQLYHEYQKEGNYLHCYTVTFNRRPGMLFTLLIDNDWQNRETNISVPLLPALVRTANRILKNNKIPEGFEVLVMHETDPDGSELGFFFPFDICEYVPKFAELGDAFADYVYKTIKEEREKLAQKRSSVTKPAQFALTYCENTDTGDPTASVCNRFFVAKSHAIAAMNEAFVNTDNILGLSKMEDDDEHYIERTEESIFVRNGIDSYRWTIQEIKPEDTNAQ